MNASLKSAFFFSAQSTLLHLPAVLSFPNNAGRHSAGATFSRGVLLILTQQKVKLHFVSIQTVFVCSLPYICCLTLCIQWNDNVILLRVFWWTLSIHPCKNMILHCCHREKKNPPDISVYPQNFFCALSSFLCSLTLFDFQPRSMWDISLHPDKRTDPRYFWLFDLLSFFAKMSVTALNSQSRLCLTICFRYILKLRSRLVHGK